MRIRKIHIKNFRSLRDVALEDIEDFNILIGKNNSGKSNVLESLALFFSEFALTGGTTSGLNEYFWFNKSVTDPIEFMITIELTDEECEQIFPEKILKTVKPRHQETYRQIFIHRKIINLQGTWRTESLNWSNLPLVKDDKPLTMEEVKKSWGLASLWGGTTQKVPTTEPLEVAPEMLSVIFEGIVEKIKGRFKLISAIRDVKNPIAHRMTLLDSQVQSSLWSLDQSTKVPDERKYAAIEGSFSKITGQRLDPVQGQIFIRREAIHFPLYFEGGGTQGAINLLYDLKSEPEKGYIFGVEEPETHSHPSFQRKLFDELKDLSIDGHQIFVATHSPIFIDRADPSGAWIVKLVDVETKVEKIKELKEIVQEIGAKPSDIFFFANRILFVEGKTEEIILPAFAHRLGVDLKDVAIIPVEGKAKARLNLKAWVKITRNALPIFLILDNDARQEVEELVKEGLIEPENYHFWQNGTIENYYPEEILKDAFSELNSRYTLGMKVEEVLEQVRRGLLSLGKVDLGEKRTLLDKSWKIVLAESIAKLVMEKEVRISNEVRRVLEKVAPYS